MKNGKYSRISIRFQGHMFFLRYCYKNARPVLHFRSSMFSVFINNIAVGLLNCDILFFFRIILMFIIFHLGIYALFEFN